MVLNNFENKVHIKAFNKSDMDLYNTILKYCTIIQRF